MNANQNPYGVEVGQVWASTDKRDNRRTVEVLAIEGAQAVVKSPTGHGSKSRIRLDRFRPGSTGYERVR